jgi:2,3-bisphosphoglycerate-independent phosphoglycerate mutase
MILDGWGINPDCNNNAVCLADTPHLDQLFNRLPHTRIGASGEDVGLPDGQMGNSEVGHLNLGAGRVVYQDLTRISRSIHDGTLQTNRVLTNAFSALKNSKGKLHLMGLLSDGGVHSHISHLFALIDMAKQFGINEICIHAFLDGRDTPPTSGSGYLQQLEDELQRQQIGQVCSVMGRFYAMDRDNRWERVERAYLALTEGIGITCQSSSEAIESAYTAGQNDEFVEPRVIFENDRPCGTIDDGDAVIFYNFRSDRAREITRALTQDDFIGFVRNKIPQISSYVCMTEYDETFVLPIVFPSDNYPNGLGEVMAANNLRQLRIAETEKYAHVTFFFNGGRELPFRGEDRALIPSPTDVETYDQKPMMSASAVTDEVVRRIESGSYDLIVLNYANPDMVGHTGNLQAAIEAMQTVDTCVDRVVTALEKVGGLALITADHGNCEQMADKQGHPHTAHSTNPVPLLLLGGHDDMSLRTGILADIAPTLLELMGLDQPAEMTGHSLIVTRSN